MQPIRRRRAVGDAVAARQIRKTADGVLPAAHATSRRVAHASTCYRHARDLQKGRSSRLGPAAFQAFGPKPAKAEVDTRRFAAAFGPSPGGRPTLAVTAPRARPALASQGGQRFARPVRPSPGAWRRRGHEKKICTEGVSVGSVRWVVRPRPSQLVRLGPAQREQHHDTGGKKRHDGRAENRPRRRTRPYDPGRAGLRQKQNASGNQQACDGCSPSSRLQPVL